MPTSTGPSRPLSSAQTAVPISDELPWKKSVEHYVFQLRAAFQVPNPKEFAELLVYPVRVNTASRCTAAIPSAAVFVRHFNEIVRGRVAATLKARDVDYHSTWQGVSFGNGSIWIDPFEDDKPKVLAFNSDAWRIDGLPCDEESATTIPSWLTGSWRVTSVAILQGGQLVPRGPTTWIGKTIDIDVTGRTAMLALNDSKGQRCAIERFAKRRSEGTRELSAAFAGLISGNTTQILDLKCRAENGYYIERVEVINRKLLAIVGDDKYLLILRRGKQAGKSLPDDTVQLSGCGDPPTTCRLGQVCTASQSPGGTIVESCVNID